MIRKKQVFLLQWKNCFNFNYVNDIAAAYSLNSVSNHKSVSQVVLHVQGTRLIVCVLNYSIYVTLNIYKMHMLLPYTGDQICISQ